MAESKRGRATAREASQLAEVDKYVEEAEVDKSKAEKALNSIKDDHKKEVEAARQREKELSKVKVSSSNVKFIQTQMEMTQEKAERVLKVHKDDVIAAVRSLLA
ncbi:hypothetical protein AAMO2058_000456500 [Amorphochlora amoebiformis]